MRDWLLGRLSARSARTWNAWKVPILILALAVGLWIGSVLR